MEAVEPIAAPATNPITTLPVVPVGSDFEHLTGAIEGAVFDICTYRHVAWNHCVLIHCHGYRPEGTGLQANIPDQDEFYSKIMRQGWMVAMTSYRREGLIVADAIKDVNNLRNHICNERGYIYWAILEGRSMGGAIVTYISEMEYSQTLYQGAYLTGAALLVKPDKEDLVFSHRPHFPLLYLTNVSELGPIVSYINGVQVEEGVTKPALWEVSREGHNWVNTDERFDAFDNLLQWIFYGTFITVRKHNKTVVKKPASVMRREDHPVSKLTGGWATVREKNVHGAFITTLTEADLASLGIRMNSALTLRLRDQEVECRFSAHPFVGIPEGSWVCFEDPEGHIEFCLLTFRYKHALHELGLQLGDEIHVSLRDKPKPKKLQLPSMFASSPPSSPSLSKASAPHSLPLPALPPKPPAQAETAKAAVDEQKKP